MELPIHLHSRHHILITFYHISCDVSLKASKSGKLPPVASAGQIIVLGNHKGQV